MAPKAMRVVREDRKDMSRNKDPSKTQRANEQGQKEDVQ